MTGKTDKYKWDFQPRFRKSAFGWKSQPAITRIKQAVAEIKKVARKNPDLGAEGAVLFFEKVSAAIEKVDGSSGSIGNAVNRAIQELVPIISDAHVDDTTRSDWLERLWTAHQNDEIPYIESLGDYWGDLCATAEIATVWADKTIDTVSACWSSTRNGAYFHGTSACLSSLLKAGRYEELLTLLESDRHKMWHYQQFGVRALAKMGKVSAAIDFAHSCDNRYGGFEHPARTCEEILLAAGRIDEAYRQYAISANQGNSYIATYRAIAKKYPTIKPKDILTDLIGAHPGDEGKWFATAKELKFFDLALELAHTGPCDPRTLARAARDHVDSNPEFSMKVGMAALNWLFKGYGYDVTSADVWAAYEPALQAACKLGQEADFLARISKAVEHGLTENNWVAEYLARRIH